MTDRIEPGCLAVTVNVPPSEVPDGMLVRVIEPLDAREVRRDLLLLSLHCVDCAMFALRYLDTFGSEHHWMCEVEEAPPGAQVPKRAAFPERMLRRLPPPSTEFLTRQKDLEVTA